MATYYSDIVNKRSCVYRLYDAAGDLLYIGISTNPLGRISQHRSKRPWGKEIVRDEVEWFDGREAAKDAERWAIHFENPRHNLMRPEVEI